MYAKNYIYYDGSSNKARIKKYKRDYFIRNSLELHADLGAYYL